MGLAGWPASFLLVLELTAKRNSFPLLASLSA
jgi:hypothetical protein